jgi:hypothetical protein
MTRHSYDTCFNTNSEATFGGTRQAGAIIVVGGQQLPQMQIFAETIQGLLGVVPPLMNNQEMLRVAADGCIASLDALPGCVFGMCCCEWVILIARVLFECR